MKKSFKDYLTLGKERNRKKKPASRPIEQSPVKQVEFLQNNQTETTITWIGHATFLIQIHGVTILTDPVWSKNVKIVPRLTEPGLSIDELPNIDIILISHGHYDHLDFATLRQLDPHILYLVPVGLKKLFHRKGFHRVEEYGWWEHTSVQNVSFHFVPAQHWARRTLFDMNTSHWGGWIIEGDETIYYCGDSGYFSGFKQIGNQFSIDVALMPIGAYAPEWFNKEVHMCPEESVRAFIELDATHFIPMHYGTFKLTEETPQEAVERLLNEWDARKLPPDHVHVLRLGQTFTHTAASHIKTGKNSAHV